jgi:type IV pilus assembly protein PilA
VPITSPKDGRLKQQGGWIPPTDETRETRRSTVKKLHTRRGGFTLIELMIVVAIIGILAAIAIPNFLRFQLKAKSSEGKTNLAAIRTAEESYFAEYGVYISSDASPTDIANNQKTTFSHPNAGLGFDQLGWSPEGQVFFNYSVEILNNNYTAAAVANIDNSGDPQYWGYSTDKANLAAKAHNAGTCPATTLSANEVVGPCEPTSGQSVF